MSSNTSLFVARVRGQTRESDIRAAFERYGVVTRVKRNRGYAFVDFQKPEDAQRAMSALNG